MSRSIAIVTTCMGRTFHLRESLPRMLAQDYEDYIVVVVDWSSPDNLLQFLAEQSHPKLHSVSVPSKQYFSLTGARNAGGQYLLDQGLQPDCIGFIDADILLPPDFLKTNLTRQLPRKYFMQRNKTLEGDLGIWGSCICPFEAWSTYRYNEEIDSYGEEDNEFYSLLRAKGYRHITLETRGIQILQHSDELRMQFYKETPKDIPNLKREHKTKFRAPPL